MYCPLWADDLSLRILRIYPFLPPLPGGLEKHILRLSQEQRVLGCQVTVAYNQGESTSHDDLRVLPGLNLRGVRSLLLRDFLFYTALLFKLRARRGEFDVVHVHGDWSAFLFGGLLGKFLRVSKKVATQHGIALRGGWLYRRVLGSYDQLYTTGAREAQQLGDSVDIAVSWQPSGIDNYFLEQPREQPEQFDVVSVSSFVPVKNIALILAIAQAMPQARFCLVGDGPQHLQMESLCREKGMGNVTFAGHLDARQVARVLATARIFLLTSENEGTPTAILEAMAAGLPIVTSASNDYSMLLEEGRNGYVVAGFDPEDYRAPISSLLADDNLRASMSSCNRSRAADFAWPQVAAQITTPLQSAQDQRPVVVQVITGFGVGGAERVVVNLARELAVGGHRVSAIGLNADRKMLLQYPGDQHLYHSLGMEADFRSFLRALTALRRFIRRERVDLLHAHMFHALVLCVLARGARTGCRIVFTSHSSRIVSPWRQLFIRWTKRLRAADVVFSNNQHPMLNASRVEVIPNGVPTLAEFPVRPNTDAQQVWTFLFVGRLEQPKNPLLLVRAFAHMRNTHCELWLAGEGSLRAAVEQEVNTLQISRRVKFLGMREDVTQLMQRAHCLVMASSWEGLPMAILEAGAVGMPVVATPVGAIGELLGEECGYLAAGSDLAAALDKVVEDPAEAILRGGRLRNKVLRSYTVQAMVERHATLYDDLLSGPE